MTLENFIKETFDGGRNFFYRPRIVCIDGFNMSVQGSETHYSHPKKMVDKYSELEIGFPSHEETLILEYAETKETPTDTVYGWVPVDVIQSVIEKHGGIDIDKTFNKKVVQ